MKRFKHSLSNYHLLTGDMGWLIPVGCHEVLAGDSFRHRTSVVMRLAPQIAPVMHPISVRLHHWYVPNRIIWDGAKTGDDGAWEDFITGGPDGAFDGTYPLINFGSGVQKGSLADYLGVPTLDDSLQVCALPFRAYNKIYDEFYRDQDLVDEIGLSNIQLQRIGWEKDYFTAARPWTQKGPDVTLPLGSRAPVRGIGKGDQTYTQPGAVHEAGGVDRTYDSAQIVYGETAAGTFRVEEDPDHPGYPGLYADLSDAEAIDVNDFRRLFALQRYQEARARYGSRYTEYLAYLGIRASDQRLQRPEFLGGGRGYVSFSEVLQTQDTGSQGPGDNHQHLGDLGGHGIATMRTRRYRRFFEEHGWVISLLSVRPKVMYLDGLHRKWSRRTKEDYYQKELEAIGQQEVFDSEIYAEGSTGDTWGYVDRYRDYREEPSRISGDFRDTLNFWHLARDFDSAPALNQAFIECDPSKRIFAEQTQNSLWCTVVHSLQARRMVNRTAHSRII